jgi:putative membrane protein
MKDTQSVVQFRFRLGLLLLFVLISSVLLINPIYAREQWLQQTHLPVVLPFLLLWTRSTSISNAGYLGFLLFLLVHAIGARWIYSFVPYDDVTRWLFGLNLTAEMGWSRNMYDRFVHFAYGLFLFYPVRDLLHRRMKYTGRGALFVAWHIVLSTSLIYEVFEWALTLLMSPKDAESYNGQQGDMWDAQKDMGLAMLGASISLMLGLLFRKTIGDRRS